MSIANKVMTTYVLTNNRMMNVWILNKYSKEL